MGIKFNKSRVMEPRTFESFCQSASTCKYFKRVH